MKIRYTTSAVALFLCLPSSACLKAQSPQAGSVQPAREPTPATKMESFKPAAGSVMTLGYDELGRIGQISVDVREMHNSAGDRVRGLVVDVRESQYRTERAFVDADEISELIKGFDALLQINSNPTSFKNFEVRYATRGQLELTAFNGSRDGISYSVKAGRVTGASAFLKSDQMTQLRGLFVAASRKLESSNSGK